MKTTMPMRLRILRFLEERYVHRARPHYFPELALFGVILILAVWPILSLAAALDQDRSEEHTSELQSRGHLVCRLLLETKRQKKKGCKQQQYHYEDLPQACRC